jgi:F0F1-type ATP synthase membrane subunit b/b'
MSIHVLSNIFFRLLNTAALCALAVYVFKKYMVAGLRRTIAQRKALESAQLKKNKLAADELRQLEGSIVQEKKEAESLLDAVRQWADVVGKKEKTTQLAQLEMRTYEQQRSVKKEKELERVMLKKTVGLPALADAHKQLVNSFASSDQAQLFTDQVVSLIDELSV